MPLLSVVIPTHGRPVQVARAIASVIDVYEGFDIEILVIPNGQDDSWKRVADQLRHDLRIQWLYLSKGNASAARNHGLAHARGRYLRFLDDDDYLLPAAAEQLRLIDHQRLDICSAPLESISADGRHRVTIPLLPTLDFVVAATCAIGVSPTQGSIFRRVFIEEAWWREDVNLYDDFHWMLGLAAARDARWMQTAEPVCSYVQHDGERLSRVRRSGRNSRVLLQAILDTHEQLAVSGRLTTERNAAVAAALLTITHSVFPASPCYLSGIVRKALTIAPDATPLQSLFKTFPWLARHLLLAEWVMLPPRYLTRGLRRARWFVGQQLLRWNSAPSARSGTQER